MVTEVKSLSDIAELPEGSIDVPRGDEVLRIPIKAISLEEQEALDEKYKAPNPPIQARPNPATNKMEYTANEYDAAYLESVEKNKTEKVRALVLAGLGFKVEGEDLDEKWDSLRKKLSTGDLLMIFSAILEISNVTESKIEEVKNSLTLASRVPVTHEG